MRKVILTGVVVSAVFASLALGCNGGAGEGDEGDPTGTGPGGPGGTSGTPGSSCAAVTGNLPLSASKASTPAIVWGGGAFGVVWADMAKDEGDIHFALVDPSGTIEAESVVFEGAGASSVPAITSSDGGFLVVWRDADGTIRGRSLSGSGGPQGDAFEVAKTGNPDTRPSITTTGSGPMVAWSDQGQSFIALVGPSGPGESTPIAGASFPAVAAYAGKAGVAWGEGGSVGLSEVDAGNMSMQAPVKGNATSPANLAMATDGDRFFVAWEDLRSGEEEIYLSTLDGEVRVNGASGSANWPSVVWTGSHAAVAYYQFRDGPPQIFVTLVGPDLARDGLDTEVTLDGSARFPAIAWSSQRLGVAWAVKDGPVEMTMLECH
jgi:hypothetical protein